MHGLETIVFNKYIQTQLETIQLKCLRKNLNIQTTYINRTVSNDFVRLQVNNKPKEAKKETITKFNILPQQNKNIIPIQPDSTRRCRLRSTDNIRPRNAKTNGPRCPEGWPAQS